MMAQQILRLSLLKETECDGLTLLLESPNDQPA
jgi:hypothetical protein